MTTIIQPRAASALPSPQRLLDLMLELGCSARYEVGGLCSTHGGSLLIHDGGRMACRAAWEAASDGR